MQKKNADITCYILMPLAYLKQKNVIKSQKSINIVNIERKGLHIF